MNRVRFILAEHRAGIIVLMLYVALATAYNAANPLFEAPDERLHYLFIDHVNREGSLPIVELGGPLTEAHQAPLYYLIAALITSPPPEEELGSHWEVNPFWGYMIGRVGDDNKNQYLHPALGWWGDATTSTVRTIRLLSTAFGAGVVILTYLLAGRFVARPLALATAALVAFMPNFLLTTSAVTNDALVVFMATAGGLILVDLIERQDTPSLLTWIALGLYLGLGVISKTSFLPLLPLSALVVAWLAVRRHSWRLFVTAGVILLAGVLLVSGWWMLRNLRLYGDLTGLTRMWAVWGIREPLTLPVYRVELHNFRTTFWANFGYGNVPMPDWVYALTDVFMIGGMVGLVIGFIRTRQPGNSISLERQAQIIFLLVWTAMTLMALLWYLQRTISVTGRQLYAVLPVIALGLISGWAAIVPRRWHTVLAGAIGSLMLSFAIGALVGVLIPAYRPSPRLAVEQAEQVATHRLDWQLGDIARLVGYDISPALVGPGTEATLTLYWEPLRTTDQNYTVFVHLFGEDNALVGARDTYPGLGNDPTTTWVPGETIVDRIPVPISPDAEGPILLDIEVGLYDLDSGERLPIKDNAGSAIGYPVIGTVKLAGRVFPVVEEDINSDWLFEGGNVWLAGYEVSRADLIPGDSLVVTLYWHSMGPLPISYTTFVHLVNANGEIAAQADGIPLHGRYPTTAWGVGERFEDAYTLPLPTNLPPGGYSLLLGLYDPLTGARLPLANGADHIRLDSSLEVR